MPNFLKWLLLALALLIPGSLLGKSSISAELALESRNIEVEGDHRYYAGDQRVLVHNACPKKIKELQEGGNGTDVTVKTKAEADELLNEAFPDYQKVNGVEAHNQTVSGERKKAKMDRFKEGGAYHKDYHMDPKTGRVVGHDDPNNPHGAKPHINIKRTDGKKVSITIDGDA